MVDDVVTELEFQAIVAPWPDNCLVHEKVSSSSSPWVSAMTLLSVIGGWGLGGVALAVYLENRVRSSSRHPCYPVLSTLAENKPKLGEGGVKRCLKHVRCKPNKIL